MTAIHPQPRPHSRIHWRTPITMVILLGILAGGGWWGWKSLINSSAEPTCVEQKLPNNRLVSYYIDLKRVIMRRLVVGIADGVMQVDGKTIYEAKDLRVGLFTDEAAAPA